MRKLILAIAILLPVLASAALTKRQADIVAVASNTAAGALDSLSEALNTALDNGVTVNELKEVLIHTYAYNGFPARCRVSGHLSGCLTTVKPAD